MRVSTGSPSPMSLKRSLVVVGSLVGTASIVVGLTGPARVLADDDGLQADPFVFIGTAAQCAPSPAGSRIVTSAWLGGMGLPDNGGLNGVPATSNDPHKGLLLSKNGPSPDCSSSGARIKGVTGMVVGSPFELGFDYRNGTHCGAGAPRFNVMATDGFHFVGGCANGTLTPAPQDPVEWTRVRFDTSNPGQSFPPIAAGSVIQSISILYDEGTDTPTAEDPRGVGLSALDNIDINGALITSGPNDDDKD